MKIILLGAPASGKGTLTGLIKKECRAAHISTGDILRDNIARSTELGKAAKEYIDAGKLVPDELIIDIARDRLMQDDCKESFVLDGFPRTIPQAESLEKILAELGVELDGVVNLNIPKEVLVERIVGRRVCPTCGATFNVTTRKPKQDGICDDCNGQLVHRKDDTKEVFEKRLDEYNNLTAPLVAYYKEKGKLIDIPYIADIDEEFEAVMKALGK